MCVDERDAPFVLFSDDDADTLEMLAAYAKSLGWRYETARTAEEMLTRINRRCAETHSCFDLIVGDLFYKSPGAQLDGLSALREIRKRFRDLPFIFLSGLMEAMTKHEATKLGANVEEKPIDLPAFFKRLASIIALTKGEYHGPERRGRSFNQTEHNRRKDDQADLCENVNLATPTYLAEAHRSLAANKK